MITSHPVRLSLVAALLCVVVGAAPAAAAVGGGGGAPFTLTIGSTGTVDHLGVATVHGTVTCDSATGTVTGLLQFGSLTQPVGRLHSVQGSAAGSSFTCSAGAPANLTLTIIPYNGKFSRGSAIAIVDGFGCDEAFICGDAQVTGTVKLSR